MSRDKNVFEKWLEKYYDHFEQGYPLMITSELSEGEIISDIQACIETDTPAKEFEYEDGLIY